MLEKKISDYINKNNSPFASDVSLPETINSRQLSFYEISDKPTLLFLLIGIIISIFIFLFALTDIDKSLKKLST